MKFESAKNITRVGLVALLTTGFVAGMINTPSYAFGWRFADRHPRRAEVLGRDNHINNVLNRDYGKLGGNYGALKSEDASIRAQEQADAAANGGFITRGQRAQLNQEENSLRGQIRQDYR